MEETQPIEIKTSKTLKLPSVKNGVWLASMKEETQGMNWFKHCGLGKINATRTTLLAVQAFIMVHNRMPGYVCHYGWAYNGGSTTGLHEVTKVMEGDMHIDTMYDTPEDDVPGKLGFEKGFSCCTRDSCSDIFIADCQDHTAFAIAKQCKEMQIDFKCFKWLSPNRPYAMDPNNKDSYSTCKNLKWIEDCKQGAKAMREMCESKFGDVPSAT